MALKDKLEQDKSMSELLNETKELNQLMTSYIRVHMNEDTAKDLTIENQLERIRSNSDQILNQMTSILNRQSKLLDKNSNDLRQVLTDGQKMMQENNSQTIEKLMELETSNHTKLTSMNEEMNKHMSRIENSTKSLVTDTRSEMEELVSSTRKNAILSNWIDALKYGGTGAVLTSGILIGFYYVIL